jgi:hypothetical protein
MRNGGISAAGTRNIAKREQCCRTVWEMEIPFVAVVVVAVAGAAEVAAGMQPKLVTYFAARELLLW